MKIVALTNVNYSKQITSRHSSGKRLFELVDVILDNHGDIGDACCSIEGIEQKVGPSSTVVGATMLNTIIFEVTRKLIEQGIEYPPIFYSANIDGGDQLNQQLFKKYEKVINYSL